MLYTRFSYAANAAPSPPGEKMAETCSAWPHGFVKMSVEPEEFIAVFSANHAHLVLGDHRRSLGIYCERMDIPIDSA
jgi:L-fucose isomerase